MENHSQLKGFCHKYHRSRWQFQQEYEWVHVQAEDYLIDISGKSMFMEIFEHDMFYRTKIKNSFQVFLHTQKK